MSLSGRRIADRYELLEPVGSGGMATVWRARDLRLGRTVAVKLLRPQYAEDDRFVERFESEARHAASLAHPNIAPIHDTGVDGDERYIVMEFVDGASLAEVLAEHGRLPPFEAVSLVAAAARGLAVAHRRGIVHRDVKPGNLLLGRDGRLRVVDFGIARALTTARVTATGLVLGSVPYLSPEQTRGEEATASSDLFSLGVVLYELLTGRLPWSSDTPAATALARLSETAPPPSTIVADLPPGLDAIVARALAADPADRYPSARAFADALEVWRRRWTSLSAEVAGVGPPTAEVAGGIGSALLASMTSAESAEAPQSGRWSVVEAPEGVAAVDEVGERDERAALTASGTVARAIARPNPGDGAMAPTTDVTPLADPVAARKLAERLPATRPVAGGAPAGTAAGLPAHRSPACGTRLRRIRGARRAAGRERRASRCSPTAMSAAVSWARRRPRASRSVPSRRARRAWSPRPPPPRHRHRPPRRHRPAHHRPRARPRSRRRSRRLVLPRARRHAPRPDRRQRP